MFLGYWLFVVPLIINTSYYCPIAVGKELKPDVLGSAPFVLGTNYLLIPFIMNT